MKTNKYFSDLADLTEKRQCLIRPYRGSESGYFQSQYKYLNCLDYGLEISASTTEDQSAVNSKLNQTARALTVY